MTDYYIISNNCHTRETYSAGCLMDAIKYGLNCEGQKVEIWRDGELVAAIQRLLNSINIIIWED